MDPFGVRLQAATAAYGPLCVGIDPHRSIIEEWGLRYDLDGLERFAMTCVEAFAGQVAIVKPQSAFFEVFGSRGVAVLERTVAGFSGSGTLTLLDAKRGDIGSTMDAYAEALLGKDAVAPADAVTVSPFLGYGSLRPAIDLAARTGRGVFVLVLTSNPEGPSVQHAVHDRRTVARAIVDAVTGDNAEAATAGHLGHVGLVVGATVGTAVQDLGLDLAAANAPLLAPGFGAQGGTGEDVRRVFAEAWPNVLPSSSRGVLAAGPDASALRAAARRAAESLTPQVHRTPQSS
ncbi:MAG: orotidine-5'-phosphate decarboxylase [Nostocoides sp.]